MRKKRLYIDAAGNKLFVEGAKYPKVAVRNVKGQLVTASDARKFIRQALKAKPSIQQDPLWKATERNKPTIKSSFIYRVRPKK